LVHYLQFQKVLESFKMFQNVPKVSRMFQKVLKCFRMHQNVPECARRFSNVPESYKPLSINSNGNNLEFLLFPIHCGIEMTPSVALVLNRQYGVYTNLIKK
jgi:hypothetical protein